MKYIKSIAVELLQKGKYLREILCQILKYSYDPIVPLSCYKWTITQLKISGKGFPVFSKFSFDIYLSFPGTAALCLHCEKTHLKSEKVHGTVLLYSFSTDIKTPPKFCDTKRLGPRKHRTVDRGSDPSYFLIPCWIRHRLKKNKSISNQFVFVA